MGSTFTQQRDTIALILSQAHDGILQLKDWTKGVDILSLPQTPQGAQDLAGDVMLLQAICECVKQINKRAPKLLTYRPEIPWLHVMSMRDRIAHGYFDIDIDFVNEIITNDLDSLLAAIDALSAKLGEISDEELFNK